MPLKRSLDTSLSDFPNPKRSMYRPRAYSNPMPMAIDNRPYRNGSTFKRRSRTSYRKRAIYSGPYRALTSGSRHTNPVYPRPEVKYIDSTQTGAAFISTPTQTAVTNTGGFGILNRIVQNGSTPGRIGCRVSIKSVAYRFELDLGATAIPTSGRVVLIWDKQSNVATTYNWTDIFSVPSYLSYMDVGNTNRFVILRNQQFSLSPNGDQSLFFEGYCKINMESVWPQATTAAATPQSGALLVFYISDTAVAASQPLLQGVWRIRYIDS